MLTLIKLMTNMHHIVISFHLTTIHNFTQNTTKLLCYSSMIKASRKHIFNINSIQRHLKVLLICTIEMFERFQIKITNSSKSIFNIFKSILLSRK